MVPNKNYLSHAMLLNDLAIITENDLELAAGVQSRGNLAKRLTEAMVVEKWDTAYMWNLRLGAQVE